MKTARTAQLILVSIFAAALTACDANHLVPLQKVSASSAGVAAVDAHFCTSAPSSGKQNLKYLFILDHSASNQPGFPDPKTPNDVTNTDAQGSRRYGPLANFVQNLTPDVNTNTSFAIIDFNDVAGQAGTTTGFDSSSTSFLQTMQKDWIGTGTAQAPAPRDSGFTNYQAALQLALQLITKDAKDQAADPNQNGTKSSYVVMFVSDGIPTIAVQATGGVYTQTFNDDIGPVITSLMNLKNDAVVGPLISSITLNTAYYSNNTEVLAAEQLLAQMAAAGNGQYVKFDSGQNILYQQFAPPSRQIGNSLVDVFVSNQNMVWWDDGRLLVDSDGDGLPDEIELKLGSNPYAADSDGNGVNDLVEYRTKGHACNDPSCAPAGRDPYASCAGFSPTTAADGSVTFQSSSNDGLNDCEKFVLGAVRNDFNSNGDLIPDALAFRSALPIIPGTAQTAFSDPFNDGMNNYSKIKAGLPLQVSMKSLVGALQQTTKLTSEPSSDPSLSCYHLQVSNVPVTNSVNTIKVMIVQNQAALDDKPFLLNASASLAPGQSAVSFVQGDFK